LRSAITIGYLYPYEQEARERRGDKEIDDSNAKIGNMSRKEQENMSKAMNSIYEKFASLHHKSPESAESQAAIKELVCTRSYSLDAFKGLGQMYVDGCTLHKKHRQIRGRPGEVYVCCLTVYADQNKN
jgi:hypothetical protein